MDSRFDKRWFIIYFFQVNFFLKEEAKDYDDYTLKEKKKKRKFEVYKIYTLKILIKLLK